jgi:hypothetical protein
MKIYDALDRNPSRADQIKAGAVILVGFGILGALQFFLRQRVLVAEVLWAIGGAAFLMSLVPGLGRLLHIGWMGLGITIGIFTQPVVIAIAYVLLFVPIGFIFRAMGRDLMKRKLASKSTSYWEKYDEPEDESTYFNQY